MEKRLSGKMAKAMRIIFLFILLAVPASNASAVLLKIPAINYLPQIFEIDYAANHIIEIDHGRKDIIEIDYDTQGKFDFDREKLGRIDLDHLFSAIDIDDYRGSFEAGPHGRAGAQSEPVPEPATMLLLGTGMLGLAAGMRKKQKG